MKRRAKRREEEVVERRTHMAKITSLFLLPYLEQMKHVSSRCRLTTCSLRLQYCSLSLNQCWRRRRRRRRRREEEEEEEE